MLWSGVMYTASTVRERVPGEGSGRGRGGGRGCRERVSERERERGPMLTGGWFAIEVH